ncbi:TPA: hypothetical protein ACJKC4_002163 [Neisseria meningitidis]|uniref:hypothetical protein n=3 Tax=Neisseria meningitidis TaxID=487 RepID=UPI0001FC08ED|nr:hypothetical protein [Neisseria meningitidis]EGC64240.1 hypothetical protein NMB9615945_1620 [Neisseria meningitidis 961-5945]EGC65696.1 hypothetical protein NMB9615945_0061 [Neisseria meningitidis 961-5945]MBG8579631.1 hypothetical protein [Neisseria meningitidis]MBG8583635.1 hypothetical protein [Neisseria meningitidis]MBG8588356.1 hypothetical protein [Neisseria meningitidis]
MGFRVGMNCFDTRLQADDYLLSSLPPTVTQDGKIIRPERVGDKWILNGKPVTLSYPECSNFEQIKQGSYVGSTVLILFVVIYGFRLLINFLKDMGKVGTD